MGHTGFFDCQMRTDINFHDTRNFRLEHVHFWFILLQIQDRQGRPVGSPVGLNVSRQCESIRMNRTRWPKKCRSGCQVSLPLQSAMTSTLNSEDKFSIL